MSEELMCTEGTTKFLGPFQILDEVDEGLTNEIEEGITKNNENHEKEGSSGENPFVVKESDIKKSPKSETEPNNFIQQNVQEEKTASDKQSPEETITCEDKTEKKDTGEESTVIEKESEAEKAPESENECHNLIQQNHQEETTCEKQSPNETISCEDETEKKGIGDENITVEKELDVKEPPKCETELNNLIQENHQEEQTTCEKQSPEETIRCDDKTEKKGIGEENMIVEKELDVKVAEKSETEHNNFIQENFQEEKTICKKQSPEEKINKDDTDLKCLDNDLPNESINSEETNIKKPFIEEDEKSVKSCHTEEGKEDSISISHEDEISIKSCQDDLMIDLCEESDVAISENVDECDKDEEEQEEPKNCHPYSFMIESFELTKEQKMQTKIGPPKSLKEIPVRMVNSRIGLLKLLPVLNSAKEIALRMQIDNNQFEPSIQLMAISTRDTDYIIDVAKVNKELLLLTEVFINPKIVKIIYGAARVLSTLQTILHLYVINIFDCESAGKALQTGFKSVDMILQKVYSCRLVDGMRQVNCRSRPLSPGYQDYCRAIPHYLIYIYQDYKNKLLSKDENLYKELMAKFREASKIVYPPYRTTQLLSLEEELQNHHKCQLEVLEKLNEWRNDTAIKLNINPVTIIPKPHLITISSTLPVTEFSLCCISKSTFVKDDAEKILTIIKEARGKYHLAEKKLKSSKKKIEDFKYLLYKELQGTNLNVNPKMNNKFGKPNFQKGGEVAAIRGRNRPGIKHRKKQGFTPKPQQNTNYTTVNEDYSPGFNYFKQAAPVQDFSNNWSGGAAGSSSGASNSFNQSKIQKRGNAFKRKISNMHGQGGENQNPRKKWK